MTTRVYLAGGFRGGWQDRVIEAFNEPFGEYLDVEFVDPRKHGLKEEADYTEWDLRAIRECDVVFAVSEHDNPSGYGLMLEIGYAKALGKQIIFCELGSDPVRTRYYGMARVVSDWNCTGLGVAAMGLRTVIDMRRGCEVAA